MQSKYELTDICILYTDPQLITDVITLLRTTATKKSSVLPPKPYACRNVCSWIVYGNQLYIRCYYLHLVLRWFNIANPFYFNLSEVFFNLDQERKLHAINCVLFFAKAFISSKWRRWKFLTFKKRYACRNVCSWIVYDNQLYIWCYYLHLVLRWFDIFNSFYFNLREIVLNFDQERKILAINCVVSFPKAFISSLNSG